MSGPRSQPLPQPCSHGPMMNDEAEMRGRVVAEARTWLGTPYHHAARIKGAGVDCAMLLAETYAACGLIPRLEPEHYPPDWHLHRSTERYLGHVARYAYEVAQAKPGDLALFRVGRTFSHGAIVTAWPNAIHAYIRVGVVMVDLARHARLGRCPRRFFSLWGTP